MMSIVHDMLTSAEQKTKVTEKYGELFVLNMPNEISSDFYDLKEHIRILNLKEHVRVLSIADSTNAEGSSTIATYLAFLLAGGVAGAVTGAVTGAVENRQPDKPESIQPNTPSAKLYEIPESDKVFTASFRAVHSQPATTADVFKNWRDDLDSRYINSENSQCVLLVDADLHRPSIHRYFGLELENGLAEIIGGTVEWNQVARPVRDSHLRVITAGKSTVNPVELLGCERFRELVETWRNEFRYVVFNSPAVLQYVDALSLASAVDGVVLVVKAGQTRWDSAQQAKYKLTTAQAHLLGVALNRRKMDIPQGLYKRLI